MPTPAGVPVAIISPGISVMVDDIVSIKVGISKIRSETTACCLTSPLTFVTNFIALTSAISSLVTSHGPIGQKVSRLLPMVH